MRESFVFKDTEVYFPPGRFIHSQGKVEFTARLSIFFSLILTGIKTLGANFGLELSVKRFLGHRTSGGTTFYRVQHEILILKARTFLYERILTQGQIIFLGLES